MKVCTECKQLKPLDAYSWRYKNTPKAHQEAKCKPCRAAQNSRINRRAREAKEIKMYEETKPPCDACFKQVSCASECMSFKCWEEYGV
jgi:hypothetical protein